MGLEIGTEHVLAAALVVLALASVAGVGLLTWAVLEVRRIRRQGEPRVWPFGTLAGETTDAATDEAAKSWADVEVARLELGDSDIEPRGIIGDESRAGGSGSSDSGEVAETGTGAAEGVRLQMDVPVWVTSPASRAVGASVPVSAAPSLRCGGKNKHHAWTGVSPDRKCRRCEVTEAASGPTHERTPATRKTTSSRSADASSREPAEPRALICGETHDRHSYEGQKGDPGRRCERCGAVAPKYATGRAAVTTAEEASAWRDGRFPATSGPEARPAARREDGTRNRAALRGGSTSDLTVGGEVHPSTAPPPSSSAPLPTADAPEEPGTCPKCLGRLTHSVDEFGQPDPHCIRDGWRPVRTVLPDDDPFGLQAGKVRRREPSHGGARI